MRLHREGAGRGSRRNKKLIKTDPEASILAYIWNKHGKYPGDVYNRPYAEKLFIYAATSMQIEAEDKEAAELEKTKQKGRRRK
jgi:hypothetical protein